MELLTAIGLTAAATALIVATVTWLAVTLIFQRKSHPAEERLSVLQIENASLGAHIAAREAKVTELEAETDRLREVLAAEQSALIEKREENTRLQTSMKEDFHILLRPTPVY